MASVYPRLIEDNVYLCGFTSPKSYGAMSYFIRHPSGNWLIDSPRFEQTLVDAFAKMGGVSTIFLTHRDDVADAALYAKHFGAKRVIHEEDRSAQPDAEIIVRGKQPFSPLPGFTIIPVPGHTRGHCVLLHDNKFLFTGDHLEWDRTDATHGQLNAYRDYCWYDWNEQTRSMRRLMHYDFEWVLPGHGQRIKLPSPQLREGIAQLVERMSNV